MPVSHETLCQWHLRPGALKRLMPPWEKVDIVSETGDVPHGGTVRLRVQLGPEIIPLKTGWLAHVGGYEPGRQFSDTHEEGMFAYWHHTHSFLPVDDTHSRLRDSIDYALPLGFLGDLFGHAFVRHKLERMFRYRHQLTLQDLLLHQAYGGERPMKIAISGASGLVGSSLTALLTTGGHTVLPLVRKKEAEGIYWNPETGEIDSEKLEGLDAVVHLAGDNIAEGRWTAEKKARIRDSRVKGTRLLCQTLAKLENPPKVLVSASAIGYYGDRGSDIMREDSEPSKDFLGEVCQAWEAATISAKERGIRVVNLRVGVVLSPNGGALSKMLIPFQLGMGGNIGNGHQYMSWVALDDLVGMIYHAIATDSLSGPVNAVAPNPVENREFTKVLGKVLGRPTIAPVPAFGARMLFGEMADALLLSSTRVEPVKLKESGYKFLYPNLEEGLRHVLGHAPALHH